MFSQWREVGVVAEGGTISVGGLNPWEHEWDRVGEIAIELPHPSYPKQMHRFSVYEMGSENMRVQFAAGELSANVWGFYLRR